LVTTGAFYREYVVAPHCENVWFQAEDFRSKMKVGIRRFKNKLEIATM